MRTVLALWKPALLGILLAACTEGFGTTSQGSALQIRPSAVLLYQAQQMGWAEGAIVERRNYGVGVLGDVVLDQGTVYATIGVGSRNGIGWEQHVKVSRDQGRTWEDHTFPPLWSVNDLFSQTVVLGLQVRNGKAAGVGSARFSGAGGDFQGFQVIDLDLASNQYISNQADQSRRLFGAPLAVNGRIATYYNEVDFRSSNGPAYIHFGSYDPATAQAMTKMSAPYYGTRCYPVVTGDGVLYLGHCTFDDPDAQLKVCTSSASPGVGGLVPSYGDCVRVAQWPAGLQLTGNTESRHRLTALGPLWLFTSGEKVHALRVDTSLSPPEVELLELGSGLLVRDRSMVTDRFADFIPLRTNNQLRLLELASDGTASEIVVPRTPCVDDTQCGFGAELLYLKSLGDGAYLAFYKVDAFDNTTASQIHLFADRVTPQRRPLTVPAVRLKHAPSLVELAVPAGKLEHVCALAEACLPGKTTRTNCTEFWKGQLGYAGEQGLARFLTTEKTSCNDFRRTWPELAIDPATTYCNTSRCEGTTYLGCGWNGVVSTVRDCALVGLTCDTSYSCRMPTTDLACGSCDEHNRGVFCMLNQPPGLSSCGTSAVCEPADQWPRCTPISCDAEKPKFCQGEVAAQCVKPGTTFPEKDCTRAGETCDPGSGMCIAKTISPQCTAEPSLSTCRDQHLVYCAGTELRTINCVAAGARGCRAVTGGAACSMY